MIGADGKRLYEGANDKEVSWPEDFYSYLNAAIVSSAKTLSQPTLLVQEGEDAKVEAEALCRPNYY